jgi:molecular chaperone GrpE (heat shock protein)
MSGDSQRPLSEAVEHLESLVNQLKQVHEQVDSREDTLARMTEALEATTHDLWERGEKPLLLDLLMFYDSLQWFQSSLLEQDVARDVVAESYQHLIDEFLELLGRRDVLAMDAKRTFDSERHRAVRAVPTTIEQDDGRVLQVVRRGFMRDEDVLRKEEVLVLTHDREHNGMRQVNPTDSRSEKIKG